MVNLRCKANRTPPEEPEMDTFYNGTRRLICATHNFYGVTSYASGDVPECLACIDEYDRPSRPCCPCMNTTCVGHDDYNEEDEMTPDQTLAYQLMVPVLYEHASWARPQIVIDSPNFCEGNEVPF